MRSEFIEELTLLADQDERIILLTGDLGYMALEPFLDRHPDRFLNVGAAEQNMVGMATGLAEAGFVPFVYSIATFASLRPFEFVRNGPVVHDLPVRVVGVGGGFEYGYNGVSHYALEDLGVMRTQPGLAIAVPADGDQARAAVRQSAEIDGPMYFRVGKGAGSIPELGGRFALGQIETVGQTADVVLVAIGSSARAALDARSAMASAGVEASVAVVPGFNPSPDADLAAALGGAKVAVTLETHYVNGGLGSYVAELIAEQGLGARLVRAGVRAVPRGEVGPQATLERNHSLDAESVASLALDALGRA